MVSKATIGKVARESLIAILAAIGVDKVTSKKQTEILPKTLEFYKVKLLASIRKLQETSERASKNLLERYRKREQWQEHGYSPGDASEFVKLLATLFMYLEYAPKEREKLFIWLGEMEDQEFDILLTFLRHDNFLNWLKNSWRWAGNNAHEFRKLVVRAWESVSQNQALIKKAQEAQTRAEEKRRKRGYKV